MLRQIGAGQGLSDGVVTDVGEFAQAVEQAERLKDAGINADADVGVARLDPLQRRAGRESAFGDDCHRQPPATTSVVDVCAKLAQGAPHSGGGMMWRWHLHASRF